MRLLQPFLKLPIRFDPDTLAAEVRALPASAWVPHPTGFKGNEAVRLVSSGGEPNDDFEGVMAPTENLFACPYIMQLMAEIGSVWGRSRLMGLAPGGDVPQHVDTHYYWRTHWRIHIPVITNPQVLFSCGGETVHMDAGECWLFDSFRWHKVVNGGTEQRIHLVLDTVGGGALPDLADAAQHGAPTRMVVPGERSGDGLRFEKVNTPTVMSPWEMRVHIGFIATYVTPHPSLGPVFKRLDRFVDDWASIWAEHGAEEAGWPEYAELLEGVKTDLVELGAGGLELKNHLKLLAVLDQIMLVNALTGMIPPPTISAGTPAAVGASY